MKRSAWISVFYILLTVCGVSAQQHMQGMTMDRPPQAPASSKTKQAEPTSHPQQSMPADMRGMAHDHDDPQAAAAAATERSSIQQQAAQPDGKPSQGSDYLSITAPVQELQEPEAPDIRTASDRPAPQLLADVVARAPMTLASFIDMAETNNPTLRQAQANAKRSREQARQASLLPDPVVGYSGDHIRGGSYHGGEEGAFFSQEILLGKKLALRRNALLAEGHANDLGVEVQRARVHNDVTKMFFDALTAQASVVLYDRLLKVALDNEMNSHELERIGQEDAGDVLKAEVAAEQAKINFEEAQRMFLASFHQLADLAGQAALAVHPLLGSLTGPPELDTEAVVHHDVEESPAVQQSRAALAAQEARLKSARRENVPDLQITAGEWDSGETLDGTAGTRAGWMSFAQAGLVIPLWNRNQGNIGAAKTLTERARQEVERTRLWTENRARPLVEQYEEARSTAERYRTEILPRARRAYELETMKYQQMAQPYPHVLDAQRMLFEMQLSYIHALHDEWTSATGLQNAALTGGLDQPMSVGTDDTTSNIPSPSGVN